MSYLRPYIYLSVFVLLAACGGGSGGDSSSGTSTGGNNTGGGYTDPGDDDDTSGLDLSAMEPTLASIQTHLFTPTCAVSGCHSGSSAQEGMQLTDGDSASMLVGVPSNGVPSVNRVTPGDAENSYLIWKLEGRTGIVGERMPRGGPYLTEAQIAIIAQWITDGATKTDSQATKTLAVTTLSPPMGSRLSQSPGHILIGFNQELDASTVHSTSVVLQASGGDGGFADGNELDIELLDLSLNLMNPDTMIAKLNDTHLAGDDYRLIVNAGGDVPVQSLQSEVLPESFVSYFHVD